MYAKLVVQDLKFVNLFNNGEQHAWLYAQPDDGAVEHLTITQFSP